LKIGKKNQGCNDNINKELIRINWNIVRRIIALLHHEIKLKRSHIATKGKMGYDKCIRYIQWMEMMDLVRKDVDDDGFELVLLTDRATVLYKEKFRDKSVY
jgi:CTP-dependent riboflavin kinase